MGPRRLRGVAGVLVPVLLACACSRSAPGKTAVVTRGDIEARVTISGQVVPHRKSVISAPYAGYVRKVFVRVGDGVALGDPIVSVAQSLRGGGDEVYPIRAPFAGTVVQVLRTEGEYVEATGAAQGGNALVRIDDLSQLHIDALAPEMEVGRLKVGQHATFRASALSGTLYRAVIASMALAAKSQTDWDRSRVEFAVQFNVLKPDNQIRPGMSVVIDVEIDRRTGVLRVPHECVRQKGERIFVLRSDGKEQDIRIGLQNEEFFEVASGLAEGDEVVANDFR